MTEEFSKEDRIAFLRKKNEARKKSMVLDWTKDKMLTLKGSGGYKYLSVEKMKRNLLPIFIGAGLDFKVDYQTIEQRGEAGYMSQHWTVECNITLTDVDTGYSETTKVFGESGDSGDKAVAKAGTYALKTWLADTFMLIDGVDPDEAVNDGGNRVFIPKSEKEQEEVKSKVFAQAIPPAPSAEQTAEKPKPNNVPGTLKDSGDPTVPVPPAPKTVPPVPSAPKVKVAIPPVPKPALPKKEMSEAERKVEQLKVEKLESFVPSVAQNNMFNRIFAYYGQLGKQGQITAEFAEQLAKDRSEVGNNSEAVSFIKKYPVPDDFTQE